jgi:hypothetical protein
MKENSMKEVEKKHAPEVSGGQTYGDISFPAPSPPFNPGGGYPPNPGGLIDPLSPTVPPDPLGDSINKSKL